MPIVSANGIKIAYDEVGDRKVPAILLIMGLGTQMIAWPQAFCLALAHRGFKDRSDGRQQCPVTTRR